MNKLNKKPTLPTQGVKHCFCVGDIVKLRNHISDGYTKIGDYNVIFPPPTFVRIVEIRENEWAKYGIKVLRESELPDNLKGTQFRTVMANRANKGEIKFVGKKQSFFNGDGGIDDKYFEKIYHQPESYLDVVEDVN